MLIFVWAACERVPNHNLPPAPPGRCGNRPLHVNHPNMPLGPGGVLLCRRGTLRVPVRHEYGDTMLIFVWAACERVPNHNLPPAPPGRCGNRPLHVNYPNMPLGPGGVLICRRGTLRVPVRHEYGDTMLIFHRGAGWSDAGHAFSCPQCDGEWGRDPRSSCCRLFSHQTRRAARASGISETRTTRQAFRATWK